MRYLPHTPEDIAAMLQVVGADNLDDLFKSIPDDCRRKDDLHLPEPLSEWDLNSHMSDLAATVAVSPEYKMFIGAGSYDHYIPCVDKLPARPQRVFNRLYTLPAGSQPGNAPGHF